jgi:hypothetical protein
LIPWFKIKRIQHGSKFKQHFGRGFFALPCVCTLYLNAFWYIWKYQKKWNKNVFCTHPCSTCLQSFFNKKRLFIWSM